MDFEQAIQWLASRRSIRRFAERPVDRAILARLVEAACWAPSNHHRQGWKFVVFDSSETIRELARRVRESVASTVAAAARLASGQADQLLHYAGAFDRAPAIVLAMHKKSPAMGRAILAASTGPLVSGEALSTAMAVENLLLAAHAAGLGACVMTAPLVAGDVWNSLADLPPGFAPTCLVALGYPAEAPPPPSRKRLEHVLEYRDHL